MQRYTKSLFIFRRDLRLCDNTALNAALRQSKQTLLAFIFDPCQIDPHPYQSQPGLQFMREALQDLQQQISQQGGQLLLLYQAPTEAVSQLKAQQQIEAVFVNRDYTPYSRQRDAALQQCCLALGLDFFSHADALLNEPEQVLKGDHTPYQVFTAFYNRARTVAVAAPQALAAGEFAKFDIDTSSFLLQDLAKPHYNAVAGGRSPALRQLAALSACAEYSWKRDYPALSATSQLSPYLKFGCCSVREVFYAVAQELGDEHPLVRQLYWRDFFTHIGFHFPHVFGHAFHRRFDDIAWRNNSDDFKAWAEGRTGFPIVDAGMRELNQTGLMHNRVRMVTASFLVKDLLVDWRWGERYFAQRLLDYDPCVNNGNWQWAASTGCDAQPYFRIFNPWLQQQKFDPDCLYIKRWLPELEDIPAKTLHQWFKAAPSASYPPPMLDHSLQSQRCKALFQSIRSLS
jgi:deoxyribodipyrimidine photo-lyase